MSLIQELNHLKIPLEDIKLATENFSDNNFIGQGGFGRVYSGRLLVSTSATTSSSQGTMVAVKRLDMKFGQGQHEFLMEIVMLASYKHDNVVSLVGFCDEGNEKIIVYEHEIHGSLDNHLESDLTWVQRINICLGAARGLNYLHSGVGEGHRVLHRDIKSSNVLLDENWKAKISDFGLSKIGPTNHVFTFLVTKACGTLGYLDPVYVSTGVLTKESDVYSFGVLLFEVLCGRLAVIGKYDDERRFLSHLARLRYEEGKIDDIIFPKIRNQIKHNSSQTFSEIAYQCLNMDRKQRPTMAEIVERLRISLELQLGLQQFSSPQRDYRESHMTNDTYDSYSMDNNASGDEADGDDSYVKVRIRTIKHRISHEIDRHEDEDDPTALNPSSIAGDGQSRNSGGSRTRTSSCTKEEVDAILIQCGSLKNDDGDDENDEAMNNHHRHREEVRVSSPSKDGPGIEGFQIIGDAKPGGKLLGCGFTVRGTSLCMFQWVRQLPDGTREYIEGATNPEYVVTADDVDKLIAVECIPMDDHGRQGEIVRLFANEQNKIMCDPEMQQEIDKYMAAGQASFNVLLLMDSSKNWEEATFTLKRSNYQVKINRTQDIFIQGKYTNDVSIKIPSGLTTQFVLTYSDGSSHPFNTFHDFRMRDTLVLTMRMFQSKALDERRKTKA
ncbi:hypothetical protein LXL04_033620 [Taraxacum kok-saghyz]